MAGYWRSPYANARSEHIGMELRDNGGRLSGTACDWSSGYLIDSNVPVQVDYPNVSFRVREMDTSPCCKGSAGFDFVGRLQADSTIQGQLTLPGDRPGITDLDSVTLGVTRVSPYSRPFHSRDSAKRPTTSVQVVVT